MTVHFKSMDYKPNENKDYRHGALSHEPQAGIPRPRSQGHPPQIQERVIAWAKFANNDGTNIFASKDAVAVTSGASRWTVYRHTEALLNAGILVPAHSHTCRIKECKKGETHYWGAWGQYTAAYNLDIRMLQNAQTLSLKTADSYVAKTQKDYVAKRQKGYVAKCDATQALKTTPPAVAKTDDSSALTSRENQVSELVSEEGARLASLTTPPPPSSGVKPFGPQDCSHWNDKQIDHRWNLSKYSVYGTGQFLSRCHDS